MPFPSGTYVDQLRAKEGVAATEFDHLYGQLEGWMRKDHKGDGTHADIQADSVTATKDDTTGATGEIHADGTDHDLGQVQISDDLPDVAGIADAVGMQAGDADTGWAWFSTPSRSPFSSTNDQREWNLWDMLHDTFAALRYGVISSAYYLLPHAGFDSHLGYNGGTSIERWKSITADNLYQVGRTTGNGVMTSPSFDAANFTAEGAMTWTVASGDVSTYAYTYLGPKLMLVTAYLIDTTVGGTPDDGLNVKIPDGKTAAKAMATGCDVIDNGAEQSGAAHVQAGETVIHVTKHDRSNWTASTNATEVRFTLIFEVQ